jgi:5-oxoprolinase (ATP-hydrolysing)
VPSTRLGHPIGTGESGERRWRFYIDRGGTFTDCIGVAPDGTMKVVKVLSSDEAPLIGIRTLLGLSGEAPLPPCSVRMATTVATNALLERRGVRTLLVITTGFRDLLRIGTGARPDIFALNIERPTMLYEEVLEVDARADARGQVVARPTRTSVEAALMSARQRGIESVAVAVLHAYLAPELELELCEYAREAGFLHVTASHECAREVGFLRRTQTAVLDAYLTPRLTDYLAKLQAGLEGGELLLMQSSGDLCRKERFRGPQALLSGPAGGVVATWEIARRHGIRSAVGFDMGGTSTDVCRVSGEVPRVYESSVAGVDVVAPMLRVHTIAAGGGSLCSYDGHTLVVGPQSAGAVPGPVCYGNPRATTLTVTDVNLLLGRLQPDRFPFPLFRDRAERALDDLTAKLQADGHALDRDEVASGVLAIANSAMADAIRRVSLERGHDVRKDTLVVFGGAGGQHATSVARLLGIERILFHPLAGVLSAYGIGLARLGAHAERDMGRAELCAENIERAALLFDELEQQVGADLPERPLHVRRKLDLCYAGTRTVLTLDEGDATSLRGAFDAAHRERFGFAYPEKSVVIATLRVEATGPAASDLEPTWSEPAEPPVPLRSTRLTCDGKSIDGVPVFSRESLPAGFELTGPLCVLEGTGTIVVDPGFTLRVHGSGLLELERQSAELTPHSRRATPSRDPVSLRLFANAFMGIAEQMGAVLQQTAESTNIRERLDFSCAVFDREARLLANAPHIPVHLGAMSESVREVSQRFPDPSPGDVFVTNSPYEGGSHLPDITVVTPVFLGDRVEYFTASRGHHADVGGTTPGSMPAESHTLDEEGVLLVAQPIVVRGEFQRQSLLRQLEDARYPARSPQQNLADLEAQVAANRFGAQALTALTKEHGENVVEAYARFVREDAEAWVREELRQLGPKTARFEDHLDDGTNIAVDLTIEGDALELRFDCGPEHPGNANAPRAVTIAAVIYVLRCLSRKAVPLNAGSLVPVTLSIPKNSVLDPSPGRAVVSGNVETSQRVVDVLLGAFGVLAASQGTMNNLTFGNERFAYYETIGGGSGAGPSFDGASGVQCHMTNTRITDVEVLESMYPVRVNRFALRTGSGGAGRFRGGDGLIRELCFLEDLEYSLTSERRRLAPFGLDGGQPGKTGRTLLNGRVLPGRCSGRVAAGAVLRIETPGGGGFGAARPRDT